jgi:predicted HD phosphohydrolase
MIGVAVEEGQCMDQNGVVSFRQMKDGTREDYLLLQEHENAFLRGTADRLLRELASQADDTLSGYQVTRLEHSLQAASRAEADGADIDWIVATLLHDIGDGLAPTNHDKFAAEILRPFVREECTWVVEHHGTFQKVYYIEHYGGDPDERERFADHPCYQTCVDFCERWDQSSFDPAYPTKPLEHFAPLVRAVFARKPHDQSVMAKGQVKGLPPSAP